MPVDDNKRTEAHKLWLTERDTLDISRLAAREDRKPGELVRVIVRRSMYGTIGADAQNVHGAIRALEGIN
jgi:hypothetical protein